MLALHIRRLSPYGCPRRRGAFILTMQRLHEDDLAGHLIRRGGRTTIALPAIATEDAIYPLSRDPAHVHHRRSDFLQPDREGQAELDEQRRYHGMYNFAAQYQHNPIPAICHVVRRESLRYYEEEPARFDRIVISWDTASRLEERSDYSAGTVWGRLGDDMYLLEVIRVRREVPDLQRLMINVTKDSDAMTIRWMLPGRRSTTPSRMRRAATRPYVAKSNGETWSAARSWPQYLTAPSPYAA